jgi:hypothetical protein
MARRAISKLLPWPKISGIRLLSGTMQARVLPAAPLPGGVKVARRFVKPFSVGASPTLAANLNLRYAIYEGVVVFHRAYMVIRKSQIREGRQI